MLPLPLGDVALSPVQKTLFARFLLKADRDVFRTKILEYATLLPASKRSHPEGLPANSSLKVPVARCCAGEVPGVSTPE